MEGGFDKRRAWAILRAYFPKVDAAATMDFFERVGGHCDCEIVFNVMRRGAP